MQKLLIVEPSDVQRQALTQALQQEWEIHTVVDSCPIIDTIKYIEPEAMIINLNIGPRNGISVLQEGFPALPPVILALSNFISPYILATLESLGVGAAMRIPCTATYIKETLNDMYAAFLEKPSLLARHLKGLGINNSFAGYRCLLAAIPLLKEDPNLMMKEIYPTVAKICDLNDPRCVEHAIRTALQTAWNKRNSELWCYYFPGYDHCPSNKEFIARLAEML